MKKVLLLFLVAPMFRFLLAAEEAEKVPESPDFGIVLFERWHPEWTLFQFTAFPISLFPARTEVYGPNVALTLGQIQRKVGGVTCAGFFAMVLDSHCGVMLSGLYSVIGDNYGLSVAPFNMVDRNFGIMLGVINAAPLGSDGTTGPGIQIGLLGNEAKSGLQIGLLNHNLNSRIKWLPLLNFSLPVKEEESAAETAARPDAGGALRDRP